MDRPGRATTRTYGSGTGSFEISFGPTFDRTVDRTVGLLDGTGPAG